MCAARLQTFYLHYTLTHLPPILTFSYELSFLLLSLHFTHTHINYTNAYLAALPAIRADKECGLLYSVP